jgi:hypothetical protein
MTGELTLDFARYRRIVLATLGGRGWLLRGLGLLLMVCAVLGVVVAGPALSYYAELGIGILVALAAELLSALGWYRLAALADRPWRYEVDETVIGIRTPASEVRLNWGMVSTVTIRRDAWVLRLSSRQRVPIPRAAFSADDQSRIDELCARRARR